MMTDITSYAPAFASPKCGDTTALVRTLAAGRLNSTRKRIVNALAQSRQEAAAQALLSFGTGEGSAWRPETGLALMAYRRHENGLGAMQLAAACAGMGGRGEIQTSIGAPQWLYLDGWLTALKGDCGLKANGESIVIESDLGSVSYGISEENRWSPADAALGPWTAFATGGLAPRYVTVSGLRHSVEGFPWISDPPPVHSDGRQSARDEQRVSHILQGWRVIVNHTPLYAPWVASTAAGCLLIDSVGTLTAQSGSSYDHPGLIAIEPPECPFFCGEILVHECSHQQLLLYSMVAPLVAPGVEETCYSPIKRAVRPIDRVLTGAHAVGNMIVYYKLLRQAAGLDETSQQRFDQHQRWFAEDYRPALDRSTSLTEAGREFWSSLCKSVDAEDHDATRYANAALTR